MHNLGLGIISNHRFPRLVRGVLYASLHAICSALSIHLSTLFRVVFSARAIFVTVSPA